MDMRMMAARARKNHAGSGVVYSTLDPAFVNTNITLSGGNLVATAAGTSVGNTRGAKALSGKQYFEIVITNVIGSSSWGGGICTSAQTAPVSSGYSDVNGWSYWATGVGVRHNSANAVVDSGATSDVIGVAFDAATGNLWFSRNGTWLGTGSPNPATGTAPNYTGISGTIYPCACPWASGSVCTMRFNPASFAHAAPSGFGPVTA